MRSTDSDIRQLLGPLDPAPPCDGSVPPIPATVTHSAPDGTALPPQRHRRRSVLAAAAVAVLVAAGLVLWNSAGPTPSMARATPEPLAIVAPAEPRPAREALREIADRAAQSGVPAGQSGQTEYILMRNWYLHSQVDDGGTISALQAQVQARWRYPDNTGRTVTRTDSPDFDSVSDWANWVSDRRGTDSAEWYPASSTYGTQRPPTTVEALRQWLWRPNPPDSIGPVKTLDAARELLRERVLLPQERATLLRLLADLPGLRYDGHTEDRVGRPGEAFSLDSAGHGLPTRYTLVVDPTNGLILGYEEMLTTTAGELNVEIPAVISYETYLRTEFQ